MNNIFSKNMHGVLVIMLTCIFFISCGLETVSYITAPELNYLPENTDSLQRIYQFTTSDSLNSSESTFEGTSIYYRIYNNKTKMNSDINSIQNGQKLSNKTAKAGALAGFVGSAAYLLKNKEEQKNK